MKSNKNCVSFVYLSIRNAQQENEKRMIEKTEEKKTKRMKPWALTVD